MKRSVLQPITLCLALAQPLAWATEPAEFSFGVIAQSPRQPTDEAVLREILEDADADNLAFVTVNGVKPAREPCTDKAYQRSKALLDEARNGVIVSFSATDWANCPPESGRSSAIGRLNKLRDLFFLDDFSLGASKIPVVRQSTIAKFRGFPENSRWQIGEVMFATLNIPSNNNNYVVDAGRNSEFEDRLIANRDWLNRVFTFAQREKAAGIVLFCDGSPMAASRPPASQRDGYAETRKLLAGLAEKFPGRVLIVSGQPSGQKEPASIRWRGKIGELTAGAGWTKVKVDSTHAGVFSIETHLVQAAEVSR
ncbi:MAG TPA: hypothetical protein VEC35_00985 [Noviherbaspirillum sp.]|nr:hypothetical protein [Noviherbaspirillum sp.]